MMRRRLTAMASPSAEVAQPSLHNVPAPLTSFVGRGAEQQDLESQLALHRLVTVLGPGGTGKTRLAIELARSLNGRFDDGVWFVELAQIDDPALVPTAIAAALHVPDSQTLALNDAIAATFRHRHALLVLDNCEHVVDAAAESCERLLTQCADLRVLATSREALGLLGEAHVVLPPMATPPAGFEVSQLEHFDGAALFVDRARLVDPTFTVQERTAVTVADVVRRLDGVPLALELAAAQLDTMDVAALAERLTDQIDVLVSPGRTANARQSSLKACIDWSYSRLSPDEQRAFAALSVFPAPFDLAAAEAVVGAEAEGILRRLVRCCMVTPPRPGEDGAPRYGLLETLRAYGASRLDELGAVDEVHEAAARWLTQQAELVAPGFETGPTEQRAADWFSAEHDNLRDALRWALSHDRLLALRLAVAIAPWWTLRARYREGRDLLTAATLSLSDPVDLIVKARDWLGWIALHTYEFDSCLEYCEGVVADNEGRPTTREVVDALNCACGVYGNTGRIAEARSAVDLALQYSRQIGYPTGETFACVVHAIIDSYEGAPSKALEWARAAETHETAAISGYTHRWRRVILGDCLHDTGDVESADEVRREVLAMCQTIGDRFMEGTVVIRMAEGCLERGLADEGRQFTDQAVTIFAELYDELMITDAFVAAAWYAAGRRPLDASRLLAATEACLLRQGADNQRDQARRREVRELIARSADPEQVEEASSRGSRMSVDEAIDLARDLVADTPALAPNEPATVLSRRERELILLVAEGLTDQEISQKLFISIRTVRSHLDRIRDKTGCRRRAELTRLALSLPTTAG